MKTYKRTFTERLEKEYNVYPIYVQRTEKEKNKASEKKARQKRGYKIETVKDYLKKKYRATDVKIDYTFFSFFREVFPISKNFALLNIFRYPPRPSLAISI